MIPVDFPARPVVAHFLSKTKGSNLWAPSCFTSSWTPAMAYSSDRHFRTLNPPGAARKIHETTGMVSVSQRKQQDHQWMSDRLDMSYQFTFYFDLNKNSAWCLNLLVVSACFVVFWSRSPEEKKEQYNTKLLWNLKGLEVSQLNELGRKFVQEISTLESRKWSAKVAKNGVPGTWVNRHPKGWKKGVRLQRFGLKDIGGRLREFFRNGGRKNLKVKSKWIKKW